MGGEPVYTTHRIDSMQFAQINANSITFNTQLACPNNSTMLCYNCPLVLHIGVPRRLMLFVGGNLGSKERGQILYRQQRPLQLQPGSWGQDILSFVYSWPEQKKSSIREAQHQDNLGVFSPPSQKKERKKKKKKKKKKGNAQIILRWVLPFVSLCITFERHRRDQSGPDPGCSWDLQLSEVEMPISRYYNIEIFLQNFSILARVSSVW